MLFEFCESVAICVQLLARVCDDAFQGFLEECVVRGLVELPGGIDQFCAMRAAFRADWRGPAMPQADEQKSAKAAQTRLSLGISSLADECAARGADWQEVLDQRKREKEYADKLGLPDVHGEDPDQTDLSANNPISFGDEKLSLEQAIAHAEQLRATIADQHRAVAMADTNYTKAQARRQLNANRDTLATLEQHIEEAQS